jgi:hypothetical protein
LNGLELDRIRYAEDAEHLEQLQQLWLRLQLLKVLERDPYWARLEATADELIVRLQAKMVRRYL